MAKGKYEKWLEPDGLLCLEAWARDGLTDELIAKKIGIQRPTLYDWKNKYPVISDALKRGKEPVDIEVENALLKKALGYTIAIKEPMKIKKVLVKDGVRQETEEIVYVDKQIHVPPESVAMFFWLKNRKPEQWRDKREIELPETDTVKIVLERRSNGNNTDA